MKEMSFCPTGERQLTAWLENRLPLNERDLFATHASDCDICRGEVEIWKKLASLPAPAPGPDFQRNFNAMLCREIAPGAVPLWHRPLLGWAAAAALAIGAFFAGLSIGAHRPRTELDELRGEIRGMRSMVAMSLLQQQSAVERLRGVNYSVRLDNPEDEVVTALIQTLRGDSSVDVRLAAADALRKYSGRPTVRLAMVDSLQSQDSPMMQLALIDALVDFRERRAEAPLHHLAAQPRLDPTVKLRVEKALQELSVQ